MANKKIKVWEIVRKTMDVKVHEQYFRDNMDEELYRDENNKKNTCNNAWMNKNVGLTLKVNINGVYGNDGLLCNRVNAQQRLQVNACIVYS